MDPFPRPDDKVMAAFQADLQVFIEFFVEQHRLALGTFRPQAGGDVLLLGLASGEFEFLLDEIGGVGARRRCRQSWFNRINAEGLLGIRGGGHGWTGKLVDVRGCGERFVAIHDNVFNGQTSSVVNVLSKVRGLLSRRKLRPPPASATPARKHWWLRQWSKRRPRG